MAELKISSNLQNIIKKIVLDAYYPIGKIYITVGNENPNETIGGTWIKFGSGKCLVGVDTSQTEFNVVEKIGGEKTHTLTIDEIPSHNHYISGYSNSFGTQYYYNLISGVNNYGASTTGSTGGDKPHNNLQPYITVYMWKRTA